LGKVAKSCTAQIKHFFFLINQNYFAHICPEYGFRVKQKPEQKLYIEYKLSSKITYCRDKNI